MSDRVWYYSSGGQQQGPVSTAQLKQLASSGDIQPNDLVWTDSMANWSPASSVKGLFAAHSPATAETLPGAATASAQVESPQMTPTVHRSGDTQYTEQLQAARDFARQASREAAGAFRLLVTDPIGGLQPCYEKLGKSRALQVGAVFLVVFLVLLLVAAGMGVGLPGLPLSTGETFKAIVRMLVLVVAMIAAMVGVSALFRTLARSNAGIEADVFTVGTALLPLGLVSFLSSILRPSEFVLWIVTALFLIASTFATLILFTGYTRIIRTEERLAGIAISAMYLGAFVAARIVTAIMF